MIESLRDPPTATTSGGFWRFAALVGLLAVSASIWRPLTRSFGPPSSSLQPSNLPALESARERYAFDGAPIDALRAARPGFIVLGDSMSDRILPSRLSELTGVPAISMMRLASGSAHWYLLLKNYVAASNIPPARILVFFRETQLTDPLYRLTGRDRFSIDTYAHAQEEELNAVVARHTNNGWFRLHAMLDRTLALERTREWLEPRLMGTITKAAAGPVDPDAFTTSTNQLFALDRLRVMTADDMGAADESAMNFDERVERSVLPLILDVARAHGHSLAFTRVLRRPDDLGRPPRDSPALRRYMQRLEAYLANAGVPFFDDRRDAAFATVAYADGDHIAEDQRPRYTDLFYARLQAVLP